MTLHKSFGSGLTAVDKVCEGIVLMLDDIPPLFQKKDPILPLKTVGFGHFFWIEGNNCFPMLITLKYIAFGVRFSLPTRF